MGPDPTKLSPGCYFAMREAMTILLEIDHLRRQGRATLGRYHCGSSRDAYEDFFGEWIGAGYTRSYLPPANPREANNYDHAAMVATLSMAHLMCEYDRTYQGGVRWGGEEAAVACEMWNRLPAIFDRIFIPEECREALIRANDITDTEVGAASNEAPPS
jgi:hypothetical protein